MDRLQAMRVFVEVAKARSFAAAARALNISAASVTRQVSALEEHIGTDLLIRTTRTVRLTEAGERYEPDCERLLAEIDSIEAAAAGERAIPTGTLTITAPVLFGRLYIAPLVAEYCESHPEVDVHLVLLDRVTNMVEEGLDIALRIGRLPDSSLRATRIGWVRRVVAASPAYLGRNGVPQVPEDLKKHQIVAVSSAYSAVEWRFGGPSARTVRISPRIRCNNNAAAIGIAEGGWALTRVLSYQVARSLTKGRLRLVLEQFEEAPLPVHLVYGATRNPPAKVRTFVDFAAERLRQDPIFNAA